MKITVEFNENETGRALELLNELYIKKDEPDLLDSPIEVLDLSVRAVNCLKNADIHTLRDLTNKTEIDIIRSRNFGRKTFIELKSKLSEINLCFKGAGL